MKTSEGVQPIQRKGLFDLQGYKPKNKKLPALNLSKIRSVTPEFGLGASSSANDISTRVTNPDFSIRNAEKAALPLDLPTIKDLLKPSNPDLYLLSHDLKINSSRQALVNLENWLLEVLAKNRENLDLVFDFAVQEVSKEISVQSSNSARVVIILFNKFKEYWEHKVFAMAQQQKSKEALISSQILENLEKVQQDSDFFKAGMEEYLQKYLKSDDKNTLLYRENSILKQILIRIQQVFKIQPINFSKINDLIIEDLLDLSKRTEKRIINSILPVYNKNVKVQTVESTIIQTADKSVQLTNPLSDCSCQVSAETCEASVNTNELKRKRRVLNVHPQLSLKILAKSKTFVLINRYPKAGLDSSNFNKFSSEVLPKKNHEFQASTYLMNEAKKVKFLNTEKVNNRIKSNSFSDELFLEDRIRVFEENSKRPFTPNPGIKPLSKEKKKSSLLKAKEIIENFLKPGNKNIEFESSLSVRTLVKTIESMFFSCFIRLSQKSFKGFLDHVYKKLENRFSHKRLKEKRLKDLVTSSVREKDMLLPKIFLRSVGAGGLIGLSNYSSHTFEVLLQVFKFCHDNFYTQVSHTTKKMCIKVKVLDLAREIFSKRLENTEYIKLIQQIEVRSENDLAGNKGFLIDSEWVISYFVFIFDAYEKQVLPGVKKIMNAAMVHPSLFIKKYEFLLALRTAYGAIENVVKDPSLVKMFPFLDLRVSEDNLVPFTMVENFALNRGLFKEKKIELIKKEVAEVKGYEIDDLAFILDGINDRYFDEVWNKEYLLVKISDLRESSCVELSFLIYKNEVMRIVEKSKRDKRF